MNRRPVSHVGRETVSLGRLWVGLAERSYVRVVGNLGEHAGSSDRRVDRVSFDYAGVGDRDEGVVAVTSVWKIAPS